MKHFALIEIFIMTLIAFLTFTLINTACSTPTAYATSEAPEPTAIVEMLENEVQTEFIPDANVEIVDAEIEITFLKQQ